MESYKNENWKELNEINEIENRDNINLLEDEHSYKNVLNMCYIPLKRKFSEIDNLTDYYSGKILLTQLKRFKFN